VPVSCRSGTAMQQPNPEFATPSHVESEATPGPGLLQGNILERALSSKPGDASASRVATDVGQFAAGEMSITQSLKLWLGQAGTIPSPDAFAEWRKSAATLLAWHVSEVDRLLNLQLNAVLHHPRFQKLESSWRGLQMLVNSAGEFGTRQVLVKAINLTWKEIQRDFERANEFDNSDLFRKIYEEEFGSPGGKPFGALIGDYEIHPRPSSDHPFDDISMLGHLAGIAAASFCPFVCAASPALFGVDAFGDLERDLNLASGFQSPEFVKWRSLRKMEDSRFVGLALPRILMRKPYEFRPEGGFCFQEDVKGRTIEKYLWGNAGFAWGQVVIRSFLETGWLADIRGTERNRDGGGLLTTLPSLSFGTDREGIAIRPSTDLIVTDRQEAEFARLGFLPLCQCHGTPFLAYYSSQSIQEPAVYDSEVATANANISTMLQYMLCVSRFAHYLKVIARDEVGSLSEPEAMQSRLDSWLKQYVTPDDSASPETKARRPLRQAEVSVSRDPGKPGSYNCRFSLLPHYQLDELSASIRLQTTLENRNR